MLYRDYAKDKYQNAFQLSNAEGVPCVLERSKGKKMRNYEVYGNSVQDGTPSPENPVEIQSVGDLTTKNLLPNDWENGFINTNTGVNQYSTTFIRTKDYFTLDISKNYYISSNNLNTNNVIYWYFYDENKSYVSSFASSNNRTVGISGQAVTIPENTAFYRLSIDTTDTTIKVQIEEGSTATEYEPYHKYDIPISVESKNLFNDYSLAIANITKDESSTDDIYIGTGNEGLASLAHSAGNLTVNFINTNFRINNAITFSLYVTLLEQGIYNNNIQIISYDTNSNNYATSAISLQNNIRTLVSLTITPNYPIKNFMIRFNNNKLKVELNTLQVEYGSKATEYEPYKGSETKHIYLDEPLRKIGYYADYIDFKNQKVVRNVEVLDDTGTKTISESFGTLATPTEESIALPALKTFKDTNLISVDSTISSSTIKAKYIKK